MTPDNALRCRAVPAGISRVSTYPALTRWAIYIPPPLAARVAVIHSTLPAQSEKWIQERKCSQPRGSNVTFTPEAFRRVRRRPPVISPISVVLIPAILFGTRVLLEAVKSNS